MLWRGEGYSARYCRTHNFYVFYGPGCPTCAKVSSKRALPELIGMVRRFIRKVADAY